MAEKMTDAEDRRLASLFATEPLLDDGFSEAIVRRVQRRLWLRRMVLPVAAVVGAVIAFKPLVAFVGALKDLASLIPLNAIGVSETSAPQFSLVVLAALLFTAVLLGTKILDE